MAEQACLLSSCAGNPRAEGSNPSLSSARSRPVDHPPGARTVSRRVRDGCGPSRVDLSTAATPPKVYRSLSCDCFS